jgi:hypothetical protein
MADNIRNISETFETKDLLLIDNGNGTYSFSAGISGMVVGPRVQSPTGNVLQVQIGPGDPISYVPVFMDFPQHQIHEGEMFHCLDPQLTLNASTVKYGITVPTYANTIQAPHLNVICDTYNGSALVLVYEGATFTGGSVVRQDNKNRNSANTDGTVIKTGVTSTDGTLIDAFYTGATEKNAGQNGTKDEWVMKSNTIYRVDVIGQVNPTAAYVTFEFYADKGV